MKLTIDYLEEERFFGGTVNDGIFMPYSAGFSRDLRVWHAGNQASSFLLSNKGRAIYSEKPFKYEFFSDHIEVEGEDIFVERNGDTLKSAYMSMCKKFAPLGKNAIPPEIMFSRPQYNTWIEMEWDCTQKKVLSYAKSILKNGFPAGVFMIDDCWSKAYGNWRFDKSKFPSPKSMVKKLHEMGFKVMLWCCPFISPDTAVFRELEQKGYLIKTSKGETYISHWWNGYSAVLDLTVEGARNWFFSQADFLIEEYGIDGFKMDAGDPEYYQGDLVISDGSDISFQAKIWSEISVKYAFNELRAGFNAGWLSVVNRLRDKNHSWDNEGLNTLIPDGIAMGLCGYQYLCPDMIGGGMVPDFHREGFKFDTELFLRYAQVSAFFPMMQFSRAPWKVLNKKELKICLQSVKLHEKFAPVILKTVNECAKSGEPVLRSLEYEFSNCGYENINDQFLIGNGLLVAPQLKKGKPTRTVVIPSGKWQSHDGKIYQAGEYEIATPIDIIPYFIKL